MNIRAEQYYRYYPVRCTFFLALWQGRFVTVRELVLERRPATRGCRVKPVRFIDRNKLLYLAQGSAQ